MSILLLHHVSIDFFLLLLRKRASSGRGVDITDCGGDEWSRCFFSPAVLDEDGVENVGRWYV